MLGHRRRSRVLRDNRESGEKLPGFLGRIEQAAEGVVDQTVEISDALAGLIQNGLVEEYTDERNVVRYRIASELPSQELQYVEVETA